MNQCNLLYYFKTYILFVLLSFILTVDSFCSTGDYKYLSLQLDQLTEQKRAIEQREKFALAYLKELMVEANRFLKSPSMSVTYKTAIPPSGNKHDYISMGPYWWPNPKTSDGLPYIRKDGFVNPERDKYSDQVSFTNLVKAIQTLGLAYYYTSDENYVACADKLLFTFFVNQETRMNPNLKYGQFVPGICEGRPAGIIETTGLTAIIEGIALLSNSPKWSDNTHKGFQVWVREYYDWLHTHPIGVKERNAKNNHGTHYDKQCISMLLFLEDVEGAKNYIRKYTLKRLEEQVMPDGSQPHELSRTKSWNYSNMNMYGFMEIALMAEKIGVDLWHYERNGQIYMKTMIDWFIPYLKKEKKWKWKQVKEERVTRIKPALELVANKYNDNSYIEQIRDFQTIHTNIVFP